MHAETLPSELVTRLAGSGLPAWGQFCIVRALAERLLTPGVALGTPVAV